MANIEFSANGVPESLGCVWVHIQNPRISPCAEYRVQVSWDVFDAVFGIEDKDDSTTWDQYLREEVSELGTAMMSFYFSKMLKLSEATEERWRWVIATLDSATENELGIELRGRAVPFDPDRFLR